MPAIAVALPVTSSHKTIYKSINSIVNQEFKDYEIIIVLNGSDKETANEIDKFKNIKMKVLELSKPNLSNALNLAIEKSDSQFIARQDQDDWSYPDRFKKQIEYMKEKSQCAVLGSWAYLRAENDEIIRKLKKPVAIKLNRNLLNFQNTIIHSSALIRRDAIRKVGAYQIKSIKGFPEDLDLWLRISEIYDIGNYPEYLHNYYASKNGISRVQDEDFRKNTEIILRERYIRKFNVQEPKEGILLFKLITWNFDMLKNESNEWSIITVIRSIKILAKTLKYGIISSQSLIIILTFLYQYFKIKVFSYQKKDG
jgi:glycosyltransferase involved in cell wall biosynthesis